MANEYLRQSDLRDLTALTPEEEQSRIYAEQLADQGGVGVSLEQELARAKDPRVREALLQELASRGSDYSRDEWVPASNPVPRRRPQGMSEISKALLEGVDEKAMADLDYDKMLDQLKATPVESKRRSGLVDTVKGGFSQMARSLGAAVDLHQGDVEELRKAGAEATADAANKDKDLLALLQDIQARKNPDAGWLDTGKALLAAAANNPRGAGLLIAEQLPNSAAVLGAAGAGAAAGSLLGPVGTVAGGIIGMFGANYGLEGGGKAVEAAQQGRLSPEDLEQVKEEGLIKAGVITGVDAATFGIGGKIAGTAQRAVDRAGAKVLQEAGVNVADRAAIIAAVEANPALVGAVQAAEQGAYKAATTLGQRAMRGGAGVSLETLGEGIGEYYGEGLATGNWDKMEALIEAFSSLGQSAGEVAINAARNKVDPTQSILSAPDIQSAIEAANKSLDLNQSLDQAAPGMTPAVTAYEQEVLAQPGAAGEWSAMDQQAQLGEFEKQLNADRDRALNDLLQGQKTEAIDTTIDPVRGYVEEQRRLATPAAMEFVRQFDNGTITADQVQQRIDTEQSRLGKTDADIRIENAAAESIGQDMAPPANQDLRTQQMQNSTLAMQANQAQRAQAQQVSDNESGQFSQNRTSQQQTADVQAATTAPTTPQSTAPTVGRVTQDTRDLSAKVKGNPQINDVTVEAMAGKMPKTPKLVAHTVQKLGKMLGRRVVFFSGGGVDGTVFRDKNDNRIFVNADASVNPIRVLGHEMMHRLKTESPVAYAALRKALREGGIITDEMLADYDRDYNGDKYKGLDEAGVKARRDAVLAEIKAGNSEHLLEEMLSDLNGNRFMEADFWSNVFQKIEEQEGREKAKGIIAKLREALTLLISKLQKALSGSKEFDADKQILENLQEVRAALEDAFATYMGDLKKAGNRLEEMAGEGGEGAVQSKARDLFEDEFADRNSTVSREVVVSSKGDKEEVKLGNINSAGRQIAPTKQALENFWKWYGDGPVDETGRPILLYHSTNADISEFEPGRKTTNNYGLLGDVDVTRSGIFATPDKEFSQEYLRDGEGKNVQQIYMALQQPFDIRDGVSSEQERELVDAGISSRWLYDYRGHDWEMFDNDDDGSNHFVDTLKSLGYDGAIINEEGQDGKTHETYVAFSPDQIKSATGNRGSFNQNRSDITLSPRRNDPAWNDALKMWLAMSSHNELFKYPKSERESMQDIFADIMPEAKVSERFLLDDRDKRYDVVKKWIVTVGDGSKVTIYQDKKGDVWVNAMGLKSGKSEGAAVYAALLNYTHNNMLRMVGDPLGVSDMAVFRRTENMLASALKFGTTDHMMPADEQARPEYYENQMGHLPGVTDRFEPLRWDQSGDHLANLTNLLYSSYSNVKAFVPEIENVIYNFASRRFEWADSHRLVAEPEWQVLSQRLRDGLSGIASDSERIGTKELAGKSGEDQRSKTLQRAALTSTLLREVDPGVRGSLLATVRGQLQSEGLNPELRVSYSTKRESADDHKMEIAREERELADKTKLTREESLRVRESAKQFGLPIRMVEMEVRRIKARFPESAGWAPLTFLRVDPKTMSKKAKESNPLPPDAIFFEPYAYQFHADASGKDAQATHDKRVDAIASKLAGEIMAKYMAAQHGDKTAQVIMRQADWYRALRGKLRATFGGFGDFLAQLLGPTSANNSVEPNFKYGVEALKMATSGKWDNMFKEVFAWKTEMESVAKSLDALNAEYNSKLDAVKATANERWGTKSSKEKSLYVKEQTKLVEGEYAPRIAAGEGVLKDVSTYKGTMPTRENGKMFGMASEQIAQILAEKWGDKVHGDAPKTKNYYQNIMGRTIEATIDVWAARTLRRIANDVVGNLPRIPPVAEKTVAGKVLTDHTTSGSEFGFGQEVFKKAVEDMKATGIDQFKDATPDAIQAMVWFIEKETWATRNWTTKIGEEGSIEHEMLLAGYADRKQLDAWRVAARAGKPNPEVKTYLKKSGEFNQAKYERDVAKWEEAKLIGKEMLSQIERYPDRFVAGATMEIPGDKPTNTDMAALAREIEDAAADAGKVMAVRAQTTTGEFMGAFERSLDIELVARNGYDAMPLWNKLVEVGDREGQQAVFLSRVLREDELGAVDPTKHRPGVELYFAKPISKFDAAAMMATINEAGVHGMTLVTEGRRSPSAMAGEDQGIVGIRMQHIPEFMLGYGYDVDITTDEIRASVEAARDTMRNLVRQLVKRADVATAEQHWYETRVHFYGSNTEYEGFAGVRPGKGNQGAWSGQSIGEALKESDRFARDGTAPLAARRAELIEERRVSRERSGASFSPARSDGAGSAAGGSLSRSAGEGSRPGSVSATGIHYSQEKRSFLDSGYFGRGAKSEELERVMDAPDERIKHRIYFYVNEGRGIQPENGVGSHAHKYDLTNLYDLTADRDDLYAKFWRNKNTMESAILDAGYDGWTGGGIAILLGKRSIVPEYVGQFVKPEVAEREYSEKSPYGKLQQAVVKNNSLPGGEMSGADWKRLMPKLMPEVDVSHLEDEKRYYKDQIVKRPDATDQGGVSLSKSRQTETPEFKRWSNGNKVVTIDESHTEFFKADEPVVVEALHGTAGDVYVFDKSKANPESDMGAGFYFTNTPEDVSNNYAGEGPDLTQKIQLTAERIANETDREYDDPDVVAEAKARLSVQHGGMAMPVWVRFDNPVVLGGNKETQFTYSYPYDEETEEYGEETGTLVDFIVALRNAAGQYNDGSVEEAIDALLQKAQDYEQISASELVQTLKDVEEFSYYSDDDDNVVRNEIVRQAFEGAGFDGVIDQTVADKFGVNRKRGQKMLDVGDSTVHYIAFDPTQIKSAIGNRGQFDASNPDIRMSTKRIIGNSGRQHTAEQVRAFERTGRIFEEKNLYEKVKEFVAKRWQQGIFDQFAPFRSIDRYAYTLMRLAKGATGAFEALMHHGKLSLRDGAYDADTSGGVIENVFAPIGKESTDFLYWVAGNRAERLKREGKENLMDDRDIQAFKALDNGVTDFDYTLSNGQVTRDRTRIYADTLKKFNSFNKNVLDMAEQSGLIDPASRQFWEHEFYVPFYRVLEEDEIGGGNISKGVVRQKAFEKLKGGTGELNDLLANTLMNWHHLIDAGAKNRAAKAAVEAADRMGIAHRALSGEKKTVWFMDNGVKREYKIDDPAVMEAITGLEYAGMHNLVMDVLTKPKHWLTIGVTASPFFKVRNLIRDSVQAIATSDLSYNPIKNVVEGAKLTNRDRQEYVSALAGGGLIRFGTMLEGNEAARTRQLIKKASKDGHILAGEGALQRFYDKYLEPGVMAYNELGNRGEEINRMSLYDQLIKQGVDHATASLMARDLMDFSLQGSFTTIRFLAQVVPFFNARIQGMYKLGRATKENREHMAVVVFTAAVASLALMALAASDDDSWKRWKKREEWDKASYWWFEFAGVQFRIPKPFELGAVAHLAERSVEAMFDSERDAGKRYGKAIMDLAWNQLSMSPVPQAIKPIIDLYANKDSFTGRPIETMAMQRLTPTERYTAQTSMPARLASEATFGALSPVQFDHIVRSYFGWLGATAVGTADIMARSINNEPTKPALDYWKFATGGMVQEDQIASRYVSMMYEQAAELEQAHATYNRMRKEGKLDEAKEFAEDNADKLKAYRGVENVKKQVSQINERIRMIERSDIHPAEKRIKIRALKEQASEIAARLSN